MPESWPDFKGDQPEGWKPNHWLAAVALSEGSTLAEAGALVGVGRSAVSGWKRQWRARYGEEFLRSDRARHLSAAREIALAYREGSAVRKWAEVRAAAASANGVTADLARELAQQVLRSYLDNPERIVLLTPTDALTLAKTADMLERRADQLSGIPDASRAALEAGRVPVPNEADGVPEGLMDGLDALVGDEMSEVLEAAEESVRTFLKLVPDEDDGAIEATAREVS